MAHVLAEMKGLAALARTGVWGYVDEVALPDVPAALASFQEAHSAAVAGLRAWEDGAWEAAVATIRMDGAASEMPLPGLCWWTLLDMIHHRGQLSAYLRSMGGLMPRIY